MPNKKHPMGDIAITRPANLPPWALYARAKGASCWELVGEFGDRKAMEAQALVLSFRGCETKPVYRRDLKYATAGSKAEGTDR
jgi:hypothetical protein